MGVTSGLSFHMLDPSIDVGAGQMPTLLGLLLPLVMRLRKFLAPRWDAGRFGRGVFGPVVFGRSATFTTGYLPSSFQDGFWLEITGHWPSGGRLRQGPDWLLCF